MEVDTEKNTESTERAVQLLGQNTAVVISFGTSICP